MTDILTKSVGYGKGRAARWVVVPDLADRRVVAKVKVALLKHGVTRDAYELLQVDDMDAMRAASAARRLELWVNCMPPELGQYHPGNDARRADLYGQMIDTGHSNRAVLCSLIGWTGYGCASWAEDLWKVRFFDDIDLEDWNDLCCPRCFEDRPEKLVGSDEGIWWCGRHSTRVWEPIEYREGVSWQESRMPVG